MARTSQEALKLSALVTCLAIVFLHDLQVSGALQHLKRTHSRHPTHEQSRHLAFVADCGRVLWRQRKQQMLLGGHTIREAESPARRASMIDMLEGDLEDDWMKTTQEQGTPGAQKPPDDINADGSGEDALLDRFAEMVANPGAATEEDMEAFMDAYAATNVEDGSLPELEKEAQGDFSELKLDSSMDDFDQSWTPVWLNETWRLEVRRLTHAFDDAMQDGVAQSKSSSAKEAPDVDTEGDQLWPSATVFSRYLAIVPHPINLKGKTVVEIGAGLSLPGIVSALLGAERVLLVDKDVEPLRAAMETAVSVGIAAKVTTLHARWEELPDLLSHGDEDLEAFSNPDLIFSVDNLFTSALSESVAKVVAALLTDERQAAYLMEPVREGSVKTFLESCDMDGLTAVSTEVQTWEPLIAEEQGFEWCGQLLTVRREEVQ